MNRMIIVVFSCVVFCSVAGAQKANLEVYATRFDSIPIGVIDFGSKTGVVLDENQPGTIIANDFDLCGRFHVVSRRAFDSSAFAAAGIGIYIDGEYAINGDQVEIFCYVKDISNKARLFEKTYAGDARSVRGFMHRFTNELYELLFGDRGIFDSRVLHIRVEGVNKNVAVMDFDGFNARTITKGKVLNLFPCFAGPGMMLWTSYLRGKPDIYRGAITGGKPAVVAASRGIQVSPAVSAIDGSVLYASSKGGSLDIYLCNQDGSNARQLTRGGGVETSPCWSPSGYQIAFISDKSGNPQVYIMDAEGANQRRITYRSKYSDSPCWSPKGEKIAFCSMLETGKLEIWTVNPDGSGETQVSTLPGHSEYPCWSPDGNLIGFINRSGGKSDFYIMKPDGSRVKQVTFSGDVLMPDWGK